ncbi:MAG: cytochrome c [Candidatus Didemnitutus sp.]|nr:cytochrome c [Candidatus Didemnitutus sp.]
MSTDHHSHLEQSGASDDSIQQTHDRLQAQKPEKADGNPRYPLLLLGIMCTAVFFGSVYLAHYSSNFDPLIFNEHQKPALQAATGPVITPAMLGKRVYTANCVTCHQANGLGVPGAFPPLAGSEWVLEPQHEKHMIAIVLYGLNGPITVKGNVYNSAMTPLGGVLRDEQIANALTYVRSEWGNDAPAITAEQVAAVRAELGARGPFTVEQLTTLK